MPSALRHVAPKYTYDDYLNWEGQWELIDGFPFAMSPSPIPKHQWINANINYELKSKLKRFNECRPYMPLDWKINNATVVQPDAMVICGKISKKFLDFPPAIIFEILSPSTKKKDREVKFDLYHEEKVKYYVIIDPVKEEAEIFEWSPREYFLKKKTRIDSFVFKIAGGMFEFNFKNIWD